MSFAPESTPGELTATPSTSQPVADAPTETLEPPTYRLYRPPKSAAGSPLADLPESYFTPSTADLKAAQASLSARTQSLVHAPLRTQVMREADDKARRLRYPHVTIRIRFPDRTQLENSFPSSDKIRSVYAFVRGSLREDVKPIKFVLFQTPPKRELKVSDPKVRDQSLLDLQLAPSSVLHIKFEDESLNHVAVPAPLDPSVLAHAEDFPIPPDPDTQSSSSSTPTQSSQAKTLGSGATLGGVTGSKTKVPKWLKLGPKK